MRRYHKLYTEQTIERLAGSDAKAFEADYEGEQRYPSNDIEAVVDILSEDWHPLLPPVPSALSDLQLQTPDISNSGAHDAGEAERERFSLPENINDELRDYRRQLGHKWAKSRIRVLQVRCP